MWYEKTKNYIPNRVAKKEDQQVLGGGTGYYKEIDSSFIAEYYDKSDYIHVKGKGFYSFKKFVLDKYKFKNYIKVDKNTNLLINFCLTNNLDH